MARFEALLRDHINSTLVCKSLHGIRVCSSHSFSTRRYTEGRYDLYLSYYFTDKFLRRFISHENCTFLSLLALTKRYLRVRLWHSYKWPILGVAGIS